MVTPLYQTLTRDALALDGGPVTLHFPFGEVTIRQYRAPSTVDLCFVDAPEYFARPRLYGYPDDARRFAAFSMAALTLAQRDQFWPDVVQANDWQTGLALLAVRTGFHHTPFAHARRVFSLHNLAYQGVFPKEEMEALGIPWTAFTMDGVEFFNQLSLMKAGLTSADFITTVSPTYAQEIQTPQGGVGLDGLLRHRSSVVHGIVNGVDTEEWNPATDVFLKSTFTPRAIAGRQACRIDLLTSCGLEAPASGMPIFGVISRMVPQKGTDLIQTVLPRWLAQGACAVVLGEGDALLEDAWRRLAQQYPTRLSVRIGFDAALAHRIEAGSDFFLMPSRFEPCGLNQMYSQLYGAIPIVHAVGGLRDTVTDIEEPEGTGIMFDSATAEAFQHALLRAVELFRAESTYRRVQLRGMARNFSWERAARQYERLFTQ